jgi:hypothetical protein
MLAVVLIGFTAFKAYQSYKDKNDAKYPIGPLQLPFIGRIHDLPINFMWIKFKEWADIYSGSKGFYMTDMLGAKFLVVSEEKVIEDLLVKKAKHNSDRPLIRSLFDSKSSHGSMEYLPLMGRNRE